LSLQRQSYFSVSSKGVPIRNIADYSPFGVQLDGRTISMDSYRYGFQNQEKDDEIKGAGNSVNYKYRMHDPRVGRFFAVDPLASNYSYNSPYAFSENVVIDCIELEGLEKIKHLVYSQKKEKWITSWIEIDNNLTEDVNAYHHFNSKGQNYQTAVKPMNSESNSPERVVYNGNIKYGQNRLDMYQQFESTDKAKKSHSDIELESKISNSVAEDATYYSGLEGNHDAYNQGKWGGNKEKALKYGITTISAIISIGTGGASLLLTSGAKLIAKGLTTASMINSVDDLAGLSNNGGLTPLQQMVGENTGSTFKIILGFVNSKQALVDIVDNLDDAQKASVSVISFVNDQGNTMYGLFQLGSGNNNIDEKNEK